MAQKILRERGGEILKAVLIKLSELGGEAQVKELFAGVEKKLDLTDYEKAPYEKSGYIRWQTKVRFHSIGCVKAGYITKSGGRWRLTEQGAKILKKSPDELIKLVYEKYYAWKKAQEIEAPTLDNGNDEPEEIIRQVAYEQATEQARQEIENHINSLGPYDFQKLVAELLTAMGYHVRSIAPPGPDGGIDIVAYTDPLGTSAPRIRVQVKHKQKKMTVRDVREMDGLLRQEGDIGLLVSLAGFTSEVEKEIRAASRHIDTMDLDRVIRLWEQHYDKVRESGKMLLPLVKLYFLAPPTED